MRMNNPRFNKLATETVGYVDDFTVPKNASSTGDNIFFTEGDSNGKVYADKIRCGINRVDIKTIVTPEMENKILEGKRVSDTNRIILGTLSQYQ